MIRSFQLPERNPAVFFAENTKEAGPDRADFFQMIRIIRSGIEKVVPHY
jgi:hypothetical protein